MRRGWIGLALLALLGALALVLAYQQLLPRQRQASTTVAPKNPEALAHGRYLVEHVLLCNDCHSERDWSLYGGPPKPPLGAGRACMDRNTKTIGIAGNADNRGFPGLMCMRNITPDAVTGIGDWTDGEIIRAIREGVDRHGRGLFPIMPYFVYRSLADEDVAAVVTYMRSLDPVGSVRAEKSIDFPMNLLIQLWPEPLTEPVLAPPSSEQIAYGEYLATVARCEFCHSPRKGRGQGVIPGRRYAGGVAFNMGDRRIFSGNLTPHISGLLNWSREDFIATFRQRGQRIPVAQLEDNTLMNWGAYAGMSDEDLSAIYAFLRTLPPVASDPN